MAVYTEITNTELAGLLSGYDIGDLKSFNGITSGVENTNYLLETLGGKYILTIYEDRVDVKDLPFYLDIMHELCKNNLPCPMPIKRKNGNFLSEIKGKTCVIISFLQGKATNKINNLHVSNLGEILAKMHLVLESYSQSHCNNFSVEFWYKTFDSISSRLDEIKLGLKDEIETYLVELKKSWPKYLPKGIIHADLFPDNVFFQNNNLSGVIDFYFSCYDVLMYDVAICLNAWCFEKSGDFNMTKARKFLSSYNKIRPMSEDEIKALPILAKGAAMRFLMTRSYDWLNPKSDALVVPHDPLEYLNKLRFHDGIKSYKEYGI